MIGEVIFQYRKRNGLSLKELSHKTGIDQTLISRIEKDKRLPTEKQLSQFSEALLIERDLLEKELLTDKVLNLIKYSPMAHEVLQVAESRIEYLTKKDIYAVAELSADLKKLIEKAEKLKREWQEKLPLNSTQQKKINEYFDVAYTFESNRIEGNTLTLQETMLVAVEGLTIGGKSLNEHLEAVNHQDAISFVRDLATNKEPISKRVLMEIHRLVLKEIDSDNAGIYRRVPVRITGSQHEPPQPFLLEKLMEDFFRFYSYQHRKIHPIILAAEAHERLVSIHPFIDGNGRTARLLMNLVLAREGYPRVNIKGDLQSRLNYYQCLEKVQVDNDRVPFYKLVINEAIRSLEEHLELV